LIMGTLRQIQALVPRLQALSTGHVAQLAEQIEQLLGWLHTSPPAMGLRGLHLEWGTRTYVMGILNVTPDSFSGDGVLRPGETGVEAAIEQGHRFVAEGVDILDVGGESTRPGAALVDATEEINRVMPVIAKLRASLDTPISIDTFKAEVAAMALDAGADLVNDVWGLRQPGGGWNVPLADLVAARGVPIVIMHNRRAMAVSGSAGGHYQAVQYDDLLGDIIRELRASINFAQERGIAREQIIVDPGIGFGKTPAQNVEVLRQLGQLRSLGLPILLGTSRKSFIGRALNLPPAERVEGTAVTVALGIQAGADIVRVHDVAAMIRTARMSDVLVRPGAWERATAGVAVTPSR
jgi:dihydropteroate synthase